ncbi:MAG: methionine adenosyltransferase [Candidatus Altiarchaeales archaeon]|nr:methionine adenosyltransferase [Candidatus Altiarchaeales archaeon]
MKNITVEFLDENPLSKHEIELVERKGVGHPDSICDGLAEAVSRALSQEYMKRFGQIMHHNTDQVELVGGQSNPVFGEGELIKPVYILLSGRATTEVDREPIPVDSIVKDSAKEYLSKHFPYIDVEEHVILDQKIGMGSTDLRDVFGRTGIPHSNDTSFGVSHAPFSLTEKLVYETENYINGEMEEKIPASGQDVKVMGVRHGEKIILTIANAMVSEKIRDLDEYVNIIEQQQQLILDFISKITSQDVEVHINTGDNLDEGKIFLTVTGTSAEHGDDGSVGRGNRANGLITPYRPMSMEATAGKNPVNHVGKLYNLLSKEIAQDIAAEGAEQVYVRLMSQIGKPINNPLAASIEVIGDPETKGKAQQITDQWLDNIQQMTTKCLKGQAQCF